MSRSDGLQFSVSFDWMVVFVSVCLDFAIETSLAPVYDTSSVIHGGDFEDRSGPLVEPCLWSSWWKDPVVPG